MNEDILKKVNKDKLEKTVSILKEAIGEKEAAKVEDAFHDTSKLEKMLEGLGKKETDTVIKLINNPEAMKSIISSPKMAEILRQFINK